MSQSTPGSGQIRPDGPKRSDIAPSPVADPSHSGDLAVRLDALAGGSIATMVPTEDLILDFNQTFTTATHQRFEHRAMLGLAINAMRPAHGKVAELNERIAQPRARGRPAKLIEHLELTRAQHQRDLAVGAGWVDLPHAFYRKSFRTGQAWSWQWVFPARRSYSSPPHWSSAVTTSTRPCFSAM